MTRTDNTVGTMLQIAGILIVIINAFRALFAFSVFGGTVAFEIFLQGVMFGVLFIGFGEALKLLQGLFNQGEPEPPQVVKPLAEGERLVHKTDENEVSAAVKNRVTEFYAKRGLAVDEVEGTPYEGYVIVHREGNRDIVDLNGFKPEILAASEVERHPDLKEL
ncbi:hypothetical protein [Planococcus lenghuensis]|uniref:Uncharacterized protein n=1 Tax=Planococcus lenghuensis TaxID=2213202 RepID=A0A1Q2KVM6_9BACL|nr:hypothetical protein [Planococcus lenghuensis]AQQ52164.1 hypothetical protein B0X71_02900 [Planococcus lenghuensis]